MTQWIPLVFAAVFWLSVAGCTDEAAPVEDEAVEEGAEASPTTLPGRDAFRPTVRLGVTDWTGARLNVAIAERLIERRLGYPVDPVEVRDLQNMVDDLEAGDLDAVLELWPSTLLASEREAIDDSSLVELGPLGVEGRVGWYVPRYVVDGDLAVGDWEALLDPAIAAAFATPETGGLGRFLGTDPSYEQYDEELIDALALPFEVSYSGSDAATEAEVEAAVAAERPILLYWWRPTALADRFDLVSVALPSRTDDCVAEFEAGGPLRCDYAVDVLFKLGSPGLSTKAPEVERFLRAMRLTTDQQEAMIGQVDNGDRAVGEVADAWIEANRDTWEPWLS